MVRLAQAEAQKQCVGQVVTKPTWISQWVQTPEVAHLDAAELAWHHELAMGEQSLWRIWSGTLRRARNAHAMSLHRARWNIALR